MQDEVPHITAAELRIKLSVKTRLSETDIQKYELDEDAWASRIDTARKHKIKQPIKVDSPK